MPKTKQLLVSLISLVSIAGVCLVLLLQNHVGQHLEVIRRLGQESDQSKATRGRTRALINDTLLIPVTNPSNADVFDDIVCQDAMKAWLSNHGRSSSETIQHVRSMCKKKEPCKPGNLAGRIIVDRSNIALLALEQASRDLVYAGGWWSPRDCLPRRHVAIIISYRNRSEHLPILLRHLLPVLKRKGEIHFRVFLVEQADANTFNKGKLYNIGFKESQKFFPYDCYIFHDVDLLAEDENIPLACERSPMHLSVAIDRYGYKLSYTSLIGGVLMMSKEHVEKVNGYSNSFWYWGSEDDNMFSRLQGNDLRLDRPSASVARYQQMVHVKRAVSEGRHTSRDFMLKSFKYTKTDGLNSLQYKLLAITEEPLFTHVLVDLQKEKDRLFGSFEYFTNETEY